MVRSVVPRSRRRLLPERCPGMMRADPETRIAVRSGLLEEACSPDCCSAKVAEERLGSWSPREPVVEDRFAEEPSGPIPAIDDRVEVQARRLPGSFVEVRPGGSGEIRFM